MTLPYTMRLAVSTISLYRTEPDGTSLSSAVAEDRRMNSHLPPRRPSTSTTRTSARFIGPSENSSHRSGIFLDRSTRDVIVRRSFNVWNEKPFYNFSVSEDAKPMVQFVESLETSELNNDPDPTLPDLVDDDDDDVLGDGFCTGW